jgi:hypothetical protein
MSEINVHLAESVRIMDDENIQFRQFAHDSMRQENNDDHHMLPKRAPYHHEKYKTGETEKKHHGDHFAAT